MICDEDINIIKFIKHYTNKRCKNKLLKKISKMFVMCTEYSDIFSFVDDCKQKKNKYKKKLTKVVEKMAKKVLIDTPHNLDFPIIKTDKNLLDLVKEFNGIQEERKKRTRPCKKDKEEKEKEEKDKKEKEKEEKEKGNTC